MRENLVVKFHNLFLTAVIFTISVFNLEKSYADRIEVVRRTAGELPPVLTKAFSNKYIESIRYRLSSVFEGLDFGYYFFNGHPRERWGFEETQKLLLPMLIFAAIGLKKVGIRYIYLEISYFVFILAFYALMDVSSPGKFLPVLIILVIPVAYGVDFLIKRHKKIFILLAFFIFFETALYFNGYMKGVSESLFSPRRPVYSDVAKTLDEVKREKVIISDNLQEIGNYIEFYNAGDVLSNYQFRTLYPDKESGLEVYVDIKPTDKDPLNPYYKNNGIIMEKINLIAELKDGARGRSIIIFNYK